LLGGQARRFVQPIPLDPGLAEIRLQLFIPDSGEGGTSSRWLTTELSGVGGRGAAEHEVP
jgi:hypothetical protein